MDSEKLVKIVDTIREHEAGRAEPILANLVSLLSQSTADSLNQAESLRQELAEIFNSSPVNDFPPSYLKIIEKLDGSRYCGHSASVAIDNILHGDKLNTHTELDSYLTQYRDFNSRITAASSALSALGIAAYEPNDYEIGFTIPTEFDQMITIGEKLKRWDHFIVICGQITGDKFPSVEVTRVGNGSVAVFIGQSVAVAKIVEAAIKRLLGLYQEFQKIQKTQLEIEGLKIDNEIKQITLDNLRAAEQKLEEKALIDTAKAVIDDHYKPTKGGRGKLELRTQFEVALRIVARDIQQGVEIEVASPTTDSDVSEDEQELVKEIASTNQELKQIYSQPLDKRLLPFEVKVTAKELRDQEKNGRKKAA